MTELTAAAAAAAAADHAAYAYVAAYAAADHAAYAYDRDLIDWFDELLDQWEKACQEEDVLDFVQLGGS